MKTKSLSTLATAALLSLAPLNTLHAAPDLDGDGVPNIVDPDIDNDGIPNALDRNVDGGICRSGPHSGKYIGDHLDNDSPAERDMDDDGQDDDSLSDRDIDGDGKADDSALEDDTDGDRRPDASPAERDTDGDGRNDDDDAEDDIDGDGFADDDDSEMDIDGDNSNDDDDDDTDGDDRGNDDNSEMDTDGDSRDDSDPSEDNDDGDSRGDRDDEDDDNDGNDDSDDADHPHEDDEHEVEVSLSRAAVAPAGSRCRVKIQRMATGKVELELDGREFPAGAYDVTVDGTVIGRLVMNDEDEPEGEQEWETNANDEDELPLNIEVIGKPITVSRGGTVFFSGTVPQPPDGGGDPPIITPGSSDLIPGPAAPAGASGEVETEFSTTGVVSLEIEIEDVANGDYEVWIGDTQRAMLTVALEAKGKVRWDTTPQTDRGELPLDFAAAGLPISIRQGEAVFFTGTVPTAGPGMGDGDDDNGTLPPPGIVNLTASPAALPGSQAEAEVEWGAAGIAGIEIEADGMAAGDYEVLIGDSITVAMPIAADKGKLRWDTDPQTDRGELLLDFAAAGKTVTIRQGDTIFFTGQLPETP